MSKNSRQWQQFEAFLLKIILFCILYSFTAKYQSTSPLPLPPPSWRIPEVRYRKWWILCVWLVTEKKWCWRLPPPPSPALPLYFMSSSIFVSLSVRYSLQTYKVNNILDDKQLSAFKKWLCLFFLSNQRFFSATDIHVLSADNRKLFKIKIVFLGLYWFDIVQKFLSFGK